MKREAMIQDGDYETRRSVRKRGSWRLPWWSETPTVNGTRVSPQQTSPQVAWLPLPPTFNHPFTDLYQLDFTRNQSRHLRKDAPQEESYELQGGGKEVRRKPSEEA
jgi:hypothetical protein